MIQNFRGKVAVVTGAAGGIGRALAIGFAQEGMRVVAADIDEDGAKATAESIGSDAMAFGVDVAQSGSVAALAEASFDTFGQVDLLVNNAGVFQGGLSWERSVEDWEWTLGVNLWGILHAIRSFVPRMIAQGTEGHVVNTASVAAFVAGPASAPYVVSKCAALSATECLALDLAAVESEVGASVLTPSAFETGIATTARVRPARFGVDSSPDGKGTAQALDAMVSDGMPPEAALEPVLAGIRSGDFLIPTSPSYQGQIRNRYEALLDRQLPAMMEVD